MIGSHNLRDQTLALAGVAQAARIVDQLSRTGTYPVEYLEASLHSLFSFDASDVEGVFGNIQGVKLGLQNLAAGLAPGGDETAGAMMRYFFAILHLEGKFASRTDLQEVVRLFHGEENPHAVQKLVQRIDLRHLHSLSSNILG